MEYIIEVVTWLVAQLGYAGIFFMMVLESTFFPFPSEIAMVPAGYLSSQGEMNFAIAFLAWTLWAIVWSCINYFIGWKLWGPMIKSFVEKYWKYVFLTPAHYDKTEYFFLDHWSVATFLWRLVTWIRQIISLPAWAFKMNFWKFLFYTGAWAGLWNLVLMVIWYLAWENRELIKEYSFLAFIASFIIVWISTYIYFQRRRYPNKIKTSSLVFLDAEWKLLVEDRKNNSKHWEKWALFWWPHDYREKPKDTIIRETNNQLELDISETVHYLWTVNEKIRERHATSKRTIFYIKTGKLLDVETFLKNENAKFIDPSDLERLEWFYLRWKNLKKLQKLIQKAEKKLVVERHKELQKIKDENSF